MKTIISPVSAETHSERISELARAMSRESDLADQFAQAVKWFLRDGNIPSRQAMQDAVDAWEEARHV